MSYTNNIIDRTPTAPTSIVTAIKDSVKINPNGTSSGTYDVLLRSHNYKLLKETWAGSSEVEQMTLNH